MVPQVVLDHLEAVTSGDESAIRRVWEPDGVVEFPYADALGVPPRLEGIAAIESYFGPPRRWTDWAFTGFDAITVVDGREGITEFHGSARVADTGERYEQDYVVRFRVGDHGRLVFWREYWDPTRASTGENG